MAIDYTVLPFRQLNKYVNEVGVENQVQNPENLSNIYYLKNGKIALYPAAYNKGILFASYEDYRATVVDNIIPLKDSLNSTEYDQEKMNLILDGDNILNTELDYFFNSAKYERSSYDFEKLDSAIVQYGKNKFYEKYYFHLCYYIGNYLISKHGGRWSWIYRYYINRYKWPVVVFKEKTSDITALIGRYLYDDKRSKLRVYVGMAGFQDQPFIPDQK